MEGGGVYSVPLLALQQRKNDAPNVLLLGSFSGDGGGGIKFSHLLHGWFHAAYAAVCTLQ